MPIFTSMCNNALVINLEAELILPVHSPVTIPDSLCNRSNLAIIHRLIVQSSDGHNTTSSCAHQNLVSLIRRLNRNMLNANLVSTRSRSVNDTLPCDSLQDSTIRCVEHAILDDDDVKA